MQFINSSLSWLSGQLWGFVLVWVLIGAGIYFTVFSGFLQLRFFGHMWKLLVTSRTGANGGISSFQAFATSLAARVGTGNLAGVAVAMTKGGPGALFWMWVTAFVGMATAYIESSLAQLYKEKHGDGTFRGGPAYYIEKGLGQKWMSNIFAIFLILSFGLAFNAFQSNSIAGAVSNATGGALKPWMVGLILVIIVAPIIFGGLRSIAKVAEIVVPFMALGYLVLAVIVLFLNIGRVPAAFGEIIASALGFKQAAWGAAGYGIMVAMQQGVKRGLFSNEAGMGSAPNAAATATTSPHHPAAQGFVQSVGVFIDTIVICSCTGIIIMLSGLLTPGMEVGGIELTQQALSKSIGHFGTLFVAIAICFFAFTSIIANYSYAETNIEYIGGKKAGKSAILGLRVVVLALVFIGSISGLNFVVDFADVSMGLMALINLIAIIILSPIAFKVFRHYAKQVKEGVDPHFNKKDFPEFAGRLSDGVWEE
ncbi:MAG: alanine/glycine:cation symporter family protein [Alphaproteobacteria bacterium]